MDNELRLNLLSGNKRKEFIKMGISDLGDPRIDPTGGGWNGLKPELTEAKARSTVEAEVIKKNADDCNNCYECLKDKTTERGIPIPFRRMIVCPECGNKRCPKATDHNLECTHSNESGQPGSRYQ